MPLRRLLVLVTAAAFAGCAGRFVNTWLTPDWQGPPLRSVLVVGKAPDAAARRTYEDAMSERLRAIGVRAEPSHRQVPDAEITPEAIARIVAEGKQDGLIAARLIGVDERTRYVSAPPSSARTRYRGWLGWGGFDAVTVRIDRVARIETQVWSLAGDGSMIWAGSSEKLNPREVASLARTLADRTVGELQELGVLPRD